MTDSPAALIVASALVPATHPPGDSDLPATDLPAARSAFPGDGASIRKNGSYLSPLSSLLPFGPPPDLPYDLPPDLPCDPPPDPPSGQLSTPCCSAAEPCAVLRNARVPGRF